MSFLSRLYEIQYWARVRSAGALRRIRGRKPPEPLTAPSNLLLIIAGLIGDSVMCTPVVTESRRLWPKARITVLGKKHNCEMLGGLAAIDRLLVTPAIPFSLRKWRELRELDAMLAVEKFDTAIILLGDEFAPALERARIPIRVGVAGHPLAPFLTHTYQIGSPRTWGPDERLNALRILSCEVQPARPALYTSEATRLAARNIRHECGAKTGRYAVIHPFGSSARQHWPLQNVFALSGALRQQGLEPVLVGGPEYRALSKQALGTQTNVSIVNTVGRLKLAELMAMIEDAAVVITTDSGPFHIAGALARPIVGLFRKSRAEHARRYSCSRILLGSDLACSNHCRWDWCRKDPCVSMQTLKLCDVMAEIQSILTTDRGVARPSL